MQTFYKQYGLYGSPPRLNSGAIYWGLVFFYAYRTYKQDTLLDLDINAYDTTYNAAFINTTAAVTGSGAGRNVSLSGCTNRESKCVRDAEPVLKHSQKPLPVAYSMSFSFPDQSVTYSPIDRIELGYSGKYLCKRRDSIAVHDVSDFPAWRER